MVKFYSSAYSYDYSFNAVSLAYFLRYPNPYSRHVASTDTIDRSYDPDTQRLTTTRLHVKRSRLPPAVLKLLPKSSLGGTASDGSTQSFILEKTVVDVKEGWMQTESRNLDWNNVLSVIERQTYRRMGSLQDPRRIEAGEGGVGEARTVSVTDSVGIAQPPEKTDVEVSVTLKSRIGEQIRRRRARWGEQTVGSIPEGQTEDEATTTRQGWFSTWSSGAVRSAIEAISLQRTERSQPKAQKGMSVVLARLREGGLEAVFEGMKRDREVKI